MTLKKRLEALEQCVGLPNKFDAQIAALIAGRDLDALSDWELDEVLRLFALKYPNAPLPYLDSLTDDELEYLNRPRFTRQFPASQNAASRIRRETASHCTHADALGCKTSRCNRTHPDALLPGRHISSA